MSGSKSYFPKVELTEDDFLDYSQSIGMDPLLWRQYLMDERAHLDYLANLACVRQEGFEIGFKEGLEEARKKKREEGMKQRSFEIAKNIRAKGIMTDERIAELVGLSLNEVKEL